MNDANVIPTSEACRILTVDRSTVSRWVRLGVLKPEPHTTGRGFRFLREHVEDLAAHHAAILASMAKGCRGTGSYRREGAPA